MGVLFSLIIVVVCAFAGYKIGEPHGKAVIGGILGFLLGPIGLLIIWLLVRNTTPTTSA